MKNVIKQIRKIKGVITVEPAGENMAVVVFEKNRLPIYCEDEIQASFVKENGDKSIFVREVYTKVIPFDRYIRDNELSEEWIDFNKPKSLKPEELVDGEIYVCQYISGQRLIFRFKSLKPFKMIVNNVAVDYYSGLMSKIVLNDWAFIFGEHRKLMSATIEEKLKLIGEEFKHGYSHGTK